MSRDSEARELAAQLEALLDDLRGNVTALSAILAPPDPPGAAEEETFDRS